MRIAQIMKTFLALLVFITFISTSAFANEGSDNFTVDPEEFNLSIKQDEVKESNFNIENEFEGNISINLTKNDINFSENDIELDFDERVYNFSENETKDVSFNITTDENVNEGNYNSEIQLNQVDGSTSKTISINLEVEEETADFSESFSLDKTELSFLIMTNSSDDDYFEVESNYSFETNFSIDTEGFETDDLNLTFSEDDFSLGSNLTKQIDVEVNSGSETGNFSGEIIVSSDEGDEETIDVEVEVNDANLALSSPEDLEELSGELDSTVETTLEFENIGNINLTDIDLSTTNLDAQDSNDRILSRDIDFNDSGFDLEPSESKEVEMEIEIDDDLTVGEYKGELQVETDEGHDFRWDIKLDVKIESYDIEIESFTKNVLDGIISFSGQQGDKVDRELSVANNADFNVKDLEMRVEDDLEEEFSANTLSSEDISFSPETFDIDGNDEKTIEVEVDISDDQAAGTYKGRIGVYSPDRDRLDRITISVTVQGDLYIDNINFDDTVSPGDRLDVEVEIYNQGHSTYRDVSLDGRILSINTLGTDLTDSVSSFLSRPGDSTEKELSFDIPSDASHGSHTMEIDLDYGDQSVTEIEEINVERPNTRIEIESYSLDPQVIDCQNNVFSSMEIKNYGRHSEDVVFEAFIRDTNVEESSGVINLPVDGTSRESFALGVSDLEPGEYTVEHRVIYSENLFERETQELTVLECEDSPGHEFDPINNETNGENGVEEPPEVENVFDVFGIEIPHTTAYLLVALFVVLIMILIALFKL